jgi:hemerythrin
MAFEWSEELATGVDLVDQQHQEIFKRCNQFVGACKSGKGREALIETLNFLGSYVIDHFSLEETLMSEHHYPDLRQHREQHQYLTEAVRALHVQLSEHGPSISVLTETNQRLLDWLINHIKKSDRALGSFLQQQWGLL